ncbi:putative squalene-hopene-cyclase [Aspergillus udagawae]|uniref:Terpene cyclase n=1 Tax=Aspergillus udagawae TaxID=91492 RepID=A0A8E0QXX3_9EURO|nr:terpene cyclase [Aspergillus udagawae]GIC93093.1 terpene cyclase [Aspergillus udagawae]
MSRTAELGMQLTALAGCHPEQYCLLSDANRALRLSVQYSKLRRNPGGNWRGETRTDDIATTAEHILMHQALGISLDTDRDAFISWLYSIQNLDGSWGINPGDHDKLSVTVEVYLALRILGVSRKDPQMRTSQSFILAAGGIRNVCFITRIHLAMFGLYPWNAVQSLLPEFIFLPQHFLSSVCCWPGTDRTALIPLLILCHHRPIFPLPSQECPASALLNELWCKPQEPQEKAFCGALPTRTCRDIAIASTSTDLIVHFLNSLEYIFPLRRYALDRSVGFVLETVREMVGTGHRSRPLHMAMLALKLEGYPVHSHPLRTGLDYLGHFVYEDDNGKRVLSGNTTFRDSSLMITGLGDAGIADDTPWFRKSLQWLQHCLLPDGNNDTSKTFDTRIFRVDNVAAAIYAVIRQDPLMVGSAFVSNALKWLLKRQNADGGWTSICCSDYHTSPDTLALQSTPDVTGHVLETFGLILTLSRRNEILARQGILIDHVASACQTAIHYLSLIQQPCGAWFGCCIRHHIYATSAVLRALAYFIGVKDRNRWAERDDSINDDVCQAIHWLQRVRNPDGGWGDISWREKGGKSTASQTALALLALLPYLSPMESVLRKGVEYLVQTQTKTLVGGATWMEDQSTRAGSSACTYITSSYTSHCFPMMAIGRYAQALRQYECGGEPIFSGRAENVQ